MTTETALTTTEHDDFSRLEAKVEKGLAFFVDVGQALAAINERRLYRAKYPTFDAYCKAKWNLPRARAYQLMEAAGGAAGLEKAAPKILDKPLNESQARALASVPSEKRESVLRDAADRAPKNGNGHPKVTAERITEAAVKVHAKRVEPLEEPADPWAQFNADVLELISELRSTGRRLNDLLDADPKAKQLGSKYAYFYSHAGTIGAVNAIVRNLEDNLPAEKSDKPPGFIPARVVASRKSMAGGRV